MYNIILLVVKIKKVCSMNTLHKWNKYNDNIYKFHSIQTVAKGNNHQIKELANSLYESSECTYVLYDPCININFNE